MKKVRTAKGIPCDFLKKVATMEEGQEQSAGGVTFTLPGHSGHYVLSHEATYEDKKLRVGDTIQEKVTTAFTDGAKNVQESLKCPLCHQIFRQAILAPCCGATFCSDCVVDRLAHSSLDNSSCPGCGREVYAHQLVANEDIRKQVEQISRASKAMALASQKERERPKVFEVDAALKDRVNRPRKHVSSSLQEEATANVEIDHMAVSSTTWPSAQNMRQNPLQGSCKDVAQHTAAEGTPVDGQAAAVTFWLPLGFGSLLTADQFNEWQQLVHSGISPQAKEEFEHWQHRMRELVPPPPSKESFEEWKRMLREWKRRPGGPPEAESASLLHERRSKRDRKGRKEHRMKINPGDAAREVKRSRVKSENQSVQMDNG